MKRDNLEVVIFCTDNYLPLVVDMVTKTLKLTDLDNIHIWYHSQPSCSPGDTGNKAFQDLMIYRQIKYADYIRTKKSGTKILFLDADTIFKAPVRDLVVKCLDEYDMAFQSYWGPDQRRLYFCGGIAGIKCSEKTVNFMDNIFIPYLKNNKPRLGTPEAELNFLLRGDSQPTEHEHNKPFVEKYDMKVGCFDTKVGFPVDGCAIYHAVSCGHSINAKRNKLNMIL